MRCASCDSQSIQKLSLSHELGVSHSRTRSGGLDFAPGGVGILGVVSTGTSTSGLSRITSPPKLKPVLWPFGLFLLFMCLGSQAQGLYFCAALALIFLLYNGRYNGKEWHAEMDLWDRQYLCLRCGSIMIPAVPQPSLPVEQGVHS